MKTEMIIERLVKIGGQGTWEAALLEDGANDEIVVLGIDPVGQDQLTSLVKPPGDQAAKQGQPDQSNPKMSFVKLGFAPDETNDRKGRESRQKKANAEGGELPAQGECTLCQQGDDGQADADDLR